MAILLKYYVREKKHSGQCREGQMSRGGADSCVDFFSTPKAMEIIINFGINCYRDYPFGPMALEGAIANC